jgi:hypothetical protein
MAFLTCCRPSASTARLPAGVHGMMSIKGQCGYPLVGLMMDTFVHMTPGESWPSTHRWSQSLHDARKSYAQYFPIGHRILGRYFDKAYNSGPGGVGSNPPHAISNRLWALRSSKRAHNRLWSGGQRGPIMSIGRFGHRCPNL